MHLCDLLKEKQDTIVWLHSGMSEHFKDQVVLQCQSGQMVGIVCTDTLGMVSSVLGCHLH